MSTPHKQKPVYLNIIWHQHQPLYLDPTRDELMAPWVRTHGTKDYYSMAAILAGYPHIHCTFNLSSVLLLQLESFYLERLTPFVDRKSNRVRSNEFLTAWGGKTDPWIDCMLAPASRLTDEEKALIVSRSWSALSVGEVTLGWFPEYRALAEKARQTADALTTKDFREILFWFTLANFDPDFLRGPVRLATETTVDLSDLVTARTDGTFVARRAITDDDCNRLIAESLKVLEAIIPVHKLLKYNAKTHSGQLELITTPYYHPILPLICDSDCAKVSQPNDHLPQRFSYPGDADVQVAKAVRMFRRQFGELPAGMWPGEGAVGDGTTAIYARHGIRWIATDEKILYQSDAESRSLRYPYRISANGDPKHSLAIVFRDTELSDHIGFTYKEMQPEDAVRDFIARVLESAPRTEQPDSLLTVILDGENAWEWYRHDHNGKKFLHGLYEALTELQDAGRVVTVTPTEFLEGNSARKIPIHRRSELPEITSLWPGSWINGNFDTWIGEQEENTAWEYLRLVREDLGASGVPYPGADAPPAREGTKEWFAQKAWEELFAAEGSDWFWWYGADQTSDTGDDSPFDLGFITHLNTIYTLARKAGGIMPQRKLNTITPPAKKKNTGTAGTMARGTSKKVRIIFQCDARNTAVPSGIFITGNIAELGDWKPNSVRMYDDGTHGDATAGDGIWSLEVEVPADAEVQYKYTNSGLEGEWNPGEELPGEHRSILPKQQKNRAPIVLLDTFGTM